jgi:hypothetical protein
MVVFLVRRHDPSRRLAFLLSASAVLFAAMFAVLGGWFHYVPPYPGLTEPGDISLGLWLAWAGGLPCAVGGGLFWRFTRHPVPKQPDPA